MATARPPKAAHDLFDEYDNVPMDSASYGSSFYWDARYTRMTDAFEWYQPYDSLKTSINEFVQRDAKILIAGCGNSFFIEDMVDDGYTNITGLDWSRVVIDQMESKYDDLAEVVSWKQANMIDTGIEDKEYDAIIDKACFDCAECTENGERRVEQYLKETQRILKPDGVYIQVSHGKPHERLYVLDNDDLDDPAYKSWEVETRALAKPTKQTWTKIDLNDLDQLYYVYICVRSPERLEAHIRHLEKLERRRKRPKYKKGLNVL